MDQLQFVNELSKLRPSATFLSLMGYRNEAGEIANYSIIFHVSYESTLRRSIEALDSLEPKTDYERIAKEELLDSYWASLDRMATTPLEELLDSNYTYFMDDNHKIIKGIKMHHSGILHLYGLVNHKRVLLPGNYRPGDSRRPLTKAKDQLRKSLPISKWRQFRLTANQVDRISVENLSFLLVPA